MKEILCGVLIASLSMSLLSGCGKIGSSQAPESQETQVSEPETSENVKEESEIARGTETGKGGGDIKSAVIFGALEDNGCNDKAYKGRRMVVEKLGYGLDYAETRDVSEAKIQMRSYADTGDCDAIIPTDADQVDTSEMAAGEYPDQKFCTFGIAVNGYDNINHLAAAYPDQHLLSSVLVGLVAKDNRFPPSNPEDTLGFCIIMDTSTPREQAAGFITGAKYANLDVEILTNYIGGYGDPATAKKLALVMYERGADIVSASTGNLTQGVSYAAEEKDRYAIGASLAVTGLKHSLSTSCKKVWLFAVEEIQMLVDGAWVSGLKTAGTPERICDYDVEGLDIWIPDNITKILDDTGQLIVDGKLVPLTNINQVEEWAKENHLNP